MALHLIDKSWQAIDDPCEHEPNWHQWGILEHTRRVYLAMMTEVPLLLKVWQVPFVRELKSELIKGKSRWDLMLIACLVHDLGKWAGRQIKTNGTYSFKGHEVVSEQLIRSNPQVRHILLSADLTPQHLDYIATVAGLHYELGKLRQVGYEQGAFDLAFLASDTFQSACQTIIDRHPDLVREIGLIYLADSLGKVEFRIDNTSRDEIEATMQAKNLSPNLIKAVDQVPINLALCRAFFLHLKNQIR